VHGGAVTLFWLLGARNARLFDPPLLDPPLLDPPLLDPPLDPPLLDPPLDPPPLDPPPLDPPLEVVQGGTMIVVTLLLLGSTS
jgi:hypothetical protein